MRQLQKGTVLDVRAIGGLHVVTVAWDFVEGQEAKRDGLLGFAIERSELVQGNVIERYYSARHQAIPVQGRRRGAGHADADLGASDPIFPMGRLHGKACDYLSLQSRARLWSAEAD